MFRGYKVDADTYLTTCGVNCLRSECERARNEKQRDGVASAGTHWLSPQQNVVVWPYVMLGTTDILEPNGHPGVPR